VGIPVEREPDGLEPRECCVFCDSPTRYWYIPKNMPVCKTCAGNHKDFQVPSAEQILARFSAGDHNEEGSRKYTRIKFH